MIWKLIAKFCARPAVADWLIARSKRTPYFHIYKGTDLYMERYWLFNPYNFSAAKKTTWRRWFPSVRVHRIVRPDADRHLHDHPWDARTIILKNGYVERRLGWDDFFDVETVDLSLRTPGDTAAIDYSQFHSIDTILNGEAWTLFITWKYQGTWGFLVDGKKVPYKQYLGIE